MIEEYAINLFTNVIKVPLKTHRLKLINAFKSDLSQSIIKVMTANEQELEEMIKKVK